MTLRLLYVEQNLIRAALSRGVSKNLLGRCALELFMSRYEIENGNYGQEDKSRLLQRVRELEKSAVYLMCVKNFL